MCELLKVLERINLGYWMYLCEHSCFLFNIFISRGNLILCVCVELSTLPLYSECNVFSMYRTLIIHYTWWKSQHHFTVYFTVLTTL